MLPTAASAKTPRVTVIIPTMASAARGESLKRAVESVRQSSRHPVHIIAVVNGDRASAEVCDWLKAQPDVQFEYVSTPSAPAAVLRGRQLVETEFFSALDDDDLYLPLSTDLKLERLLGDDQFDLVVGNYLLFERGTKFLCYDDLGGVTGDPLNCLMKFNWLSSGNALFRSKSVDLQFFENYHAFGEWTYIAFLLALKGKKVATLVEPVFVCNVETVGSLSKSEAYLLAYIPLFQRMLDLLPPRHIALQIEKKMSAAYHDAAELSLRKGHRRDAWRHHWQSLRRPYGMRYLPYTRHLFK